jgi:hypothetical protein
MEEILAIFLQFLIEFAADILIGTPLDALFSQSKRPEPERIAGMCFIWLMMGGAIAGLSLMAFPHTLISIPALRVINLGLAPAVAGLLSQVIARRRARRNSVIVPRKHFWLTLCFTLGFVLIRFVYAVRPGSEA